MNDLLFDYFELRQWQNGSGDNHQRLQRLHRKLPDALMELTPRQRQMLRMRFQDGMNGAEIARALGINKSSVSRCLQRARKTLYSRLQFAL